MDGWERKSRKTQHFCLHKLGNGGVTCEQGVWEGRERYLVCPEPDFEAWMRVMQHPAHESEQRRWWLFHRKYLKPRRQRWLRDCVHNQKGHRSCLGRKKETWEREERKVRRKEGSRREKEGGRKEEKEGEKKIKERKKHAAGCQWFPAGCGHPPTSVGVCCFSWHGCISSLVRVIVTTGVLTISY